jgi:hypothetical protein
MIYGYARASTDGQSVAAQVRELKAAGARQVLREVASGAKTDRSQLRKVLAQLDAGDVLMVTRLDRLARSTRDLLNTLAAIAGKKAGFKSLGDTWADTTKGHLLRWGRGSLNFHWFEDRQSNHITGLKQRYLSRHKGNVRSSVFVNGHCIPKPVCRQVRTIKSIKIRQYVRQGVSLAVISTMIGMEGTAIYQFGLMGEMLFHERCFYCRNV